MADTATKSAAPAEADALESIGGLAIGSVAEAEYYQSYLIYGDSGVGKTVVSGSAAEVEEMSPVLHLDVEGGSLSLRDFYPQVKVAQPRSMDDLQRVYDRLYRGEGGFKTVVIDGLTETQGVSLRPIVKSAFENNPGKEDPDVPSQRSWYKNTEQLRRLVRAYRDLPMHVIFTCLANHYQDERTKRHKTKPLLSNRLSNEVPAFVDIVLYMYLDTRGGKTRRLMLSSATDTVIAKDRSNRLPTVIQDPSMKLIYDTLTGRSTDAS